jgi:hypothetical protein
MHNKYRESGHNNADLYKLTPVGHARKNVVYFVAGIGLSNFMITRAVRQNHPFLQTNSSRNLKLRIFTAVSL